MQRLWFSPHDQPPEPRSLDALSDMGELGILDAGYFPKGETETRRRMTARRYRAHGSGIVILVLAAISGTARHSLADYYASCFDTRFGAL